MAPEPPERRPFSHLDSNLRARSLFLEMLTDEQREEFEKDSYITVRSSEGHRYRIYTNRISTNVIWQPDKGPPVSRYDALYMLCAYPLEVPRFDVFLTQKMMLETDERRFLKTAVGPKPPWYHRRRRVRLSWAWWLLAVVSIASGIYGITMAIISGDYFVIGFDTFWLGFWPFLILSHIRLQRRRRNLLV